MAQDQQSNHPNLSAVHWHDQIQETVMRLVAPGVVAVHQCYLSYGMHPDDAIQLVRDYQGWLLDFHTDSLLDAPDDGGGEDVPIDE